MFPFAKITEKYSAWYQEVALNGNETQLHLMYKQVSLPCRHWFSLCLSGLYAKVVTSYHKHWLWLPTQREAPQNKLVGIDARHINSGLKKKPDCCARAELIREVVIYLVISFWGYFVHFYRNRDHFIALCNLQHQRGYRNERKDYGKKLLANYTVLVSESK